MYINPLSDEMHLRLLGRLPRRIPANIARQIHNRVEKYLPGVIDQATPLDFPMADSLPTQPELDTQIESYIQPYIRQITQWLDINPAKYQPANWDVPKGWSYWDGDIWVSLSQAPCEPVYFLDIETVPQTWCQWSDQGEVEAVHWAPICCVALSPTRVYVWVADTDKEVEELDLTYPGVTGLSIGHNIGYDQSYNQEEYLSRFNDWHTRPMGLDTMGLWQTTRGVSNQQIPLLNSEGWQPSWVSEAGGGAGLDDVYKFYFGENLDKGVRDDIVNKGWTWVRDNMSTVLKYCFKDNLACLKVFQKLYPEWLEANTVDGKVQWLTLWAMLLQSQYWNPCDPVMVENFFNNAETAYQNVRSELKSHLMEIARSILEPDRDNLEPTPRDEQLLTLDWEVVGVGRKKADRVYYPQWLAKLVKKPSLHGRQVPIILGFTWEDSPVRYNKEDGYIYRDSEGLWQKVPNPEKLGKPVHSMMMQGLVGDHRLGAASGDAQEFLVKMKSTLVWTSMRKRVGAMSFQAPEGYPVYKDKVRVGTITRRLASSITQVAPNMKMDEGETMGKIGVNIRAIFLPPEGYKVVWADYDSQELLLAAELGDANLCYHNGSMVSEDTGYRSSSAFSVSCHIGRKEDRSTPHYLLADAARIDYVLAKNINYGVIYGLSLTGMIAYFLKANKTMAQIEARRRSQTTLDTMKGVYDRETGYYYNGTASSTFNNLKRVVSVPRPRSILSGQELTKSLAAARGDFTTTKQNWVIQEAGSSMRDRLVVYAWWFMLQQNICGRIIMTVHDEALYCVRDDHTMKMAYILQLSHLYVTAWKTLRLGLDCMAASQSYFSSVEIDRHWRKSVKKNPPPTLDMPDVEWPHGISLTPSEIAAYFSEF